MKKIISAILALAAILTLPSSCSKFLTEAPQTSIYDEMAVGSEAALEATMVGIYNSMGVFASSTWFFSFMPATRLYEYISKRTTDEYFAMRYFTLYSESTNSKSIYTKLYAGVKRCNTLIDGLKESPVDEAYKTQIDGEARFMRAFYYFNLVRLYGDLPLILEPCATEEDAYVKRDPYYKVYLQILDDLDYAYANMRTREQQDEINYGCGRSFNMAAKALEADVYAQMACIMENPDEQFYDPSKPGRLPDFTSREIFGPKDAWMKSLEAARLVINSGVYSLEPNYTHLFRWDPDNYPEDYLSKERILTLQVTPKSGISTAVLYMLWDNPQGTLAKNTHNGSAGRIRSSRYRFQKWCETYGGVKETVDGYEIYTYCEDPRFDASIAHTEVWGVDADLGSDTSGQLLRTTIYPTEGKIAVTSNGDPYIKKYFSPAYNVDSGDADYYILRYAGTLLTAADAAAALCSSPSDAYGQEAIGYVNQLLARARKSVVNADDPENWTTQPADWNAADYNTPEDLMDAIMWERFFELCYEGGEWFIQHRRGAGFLSEKFAKPFNEFNARPENQKFFSNFNNDEAHVEDAQYLRKSILLAYPEYELRYNSALSYDDQNDFYIK